MVIGSKIHTEVQQMLDRHVAQFSCPVIWRPDFCAADLIEVHRMENEIKVWKKGALTILRYPAGILGKTTE
jgi:hypothetical protein